MTAALDAIRTRHREHAPRGDERYMTVETCLTCLMPWPCDAVALLAALDRAEAVVAELTNELDEAHALLLDALEVQRHRCDHKSIGLPGCFVCDPRTYPKPEQMRRAYEDADKVADG